MFDPTHLLFQQHHLQQFLESKPSFPVCCLPLSRSTTEMGVKCLAVLAFVRKHGDSVKSDSADDEHGT